jgi:NADPH:quinone reductase-like Zn-dependent oxidoreductase
MGGLGRTIDGSYAQYTRAKVSNVVPLGPSTAHLSWDELAALPQSYATAWTCLFRNLEVSKGQRLLIRGGTSSLGRAAINLAVEAGVHVTATTRKEARFDQLEGLGAKKATLEDPELSQRVLEKFDAVLELIGNSTILDSLKMVNRGGRVCLAGFLGGLDPIRDFNPLLQMASGVHFSFFGSFVFGTPGFPLSDVPLQDIVTMAAHSRINARPWKTFEFEEIQEAHRLMENGEAHGKMVVLVD